MALPMTAGARFEEALTRLVGVFERFGAPYALIGGLAVATWGTPRATEDIDILADIIPSAELGAAFGAAGFETEWRRGGPGDPIPLLLRLRSPLGLPEVDVVCTTRSWEREIIGRSVRVRLPEGPELSVVAVEDLIVFKLMAGGPGDLADVVDLLGCCGPLPDLEGRAAERGVLDLLRRVRSSINP